MAQHWGWLVDFTYALHQLVAGAFLSWFFSLTQQREPTKKYTHRNHHSLDNSTVRKRNSEQHFHITANRQVESSGHLIFAHWQVHASGRQIRNLLRATGLALLLQMLPNAVDCCTLGGEGIGRRRENLPNESQSKSFYHSYQLPFCSGCGVMRIRLPGELLVGRNCLAKVVKVKLVLSGRLYLLSYGKNCISYGVFIWFIPQTILLDT